MARYRQRCPNCYHLVRDLERHQQRSKRCQLKRQYKAVLERGYRPLDVDLPKDAPLPAQPDGIAPWPDPRLATGPVAVKGGWGVPYHLVTGVLASSLWAAAINGAIHAEMRRQITAAGGMAPFTRTVLRGMGPDGAYRYAGEMLWRWVVEGELDDRIRSAPASFEDWRLMPPYLEGYDQRVCCGRCGATVMPSGLDEHYRSISCLVPYRTGQGWKLMALLDNPSDADHPIFDDWKERGLDFQIDPIRIHHRTYAAVWVDQRLAHHVDAALWAAVRGSVGPADRWLYVGLVPMAIFQVKLPRARALQLGYRGPRQQATWVLDRRLLSRWMDAFDHPDVQAQAIAEVFRGAG